MTGLCLAWFASPLPPLIAASALPPRLISYSSGLVVIIDTLHKLLIPFISIQIKLVKLLQELLSTCDPVEWSAAHAEFGELS